MVYQQILRNGEKIGQYSIKSSPAVVAKKIARECYISNDMKGEKTFDIRFCKNKPFKEYEYRVNVLPVDYEKEIGGKTIHISHDIQVRRL